MKTITNTNGRATATPILAIDLVEYKSVVWLFTGDPATSPWPSPGFPPSVTVAGRAPIVCGHPQGMSPL